MSESVSMLGLLVNEELRDPWHLTAENGKDAAAELAALRERVKALEEENAHRWMRCTFCDWEHHYMAGGEKEARELAAAHALECEADPRNIRLAKLEAAARNYLELTRNDILDVLDPTLKQYEAVHELAAALEGAK